MAPGPLTQRQRDQRLLQQLKNDRSSFESLWRDLGDWMLPKRVRFTTSETNRGDRRNQKIIDSTATFASRTLASGMMSGVTSPARPWFRLTVPDPALAEAGNVRVWLDDVRDRIATVFLRSNLYNKLPIVYRDMGVFGTGAFAVMEDPETVIRCFDFPVGSYYIANDDTLRVRVFARELRLTVRQVVRRFGRPGKDGQPDWSNFSERVRSAWQNHQTEDPVEVVHVVAPNEQHDPKKLGSRFKAYRSCYYEVGGRDDVYLDEAGFDEFPILAPRWETAGEDVYGTGCPGIDVLGDVKQLQVGEKLSLQAAEKGVKPPMVGPPDLQNRYSSILPGDTTYVAETAAQKFRPAHEVTLQIQHLEMKQQQARYRVQRGFFEDLFLMLEQGAAADRRQITATEIAERREEKLLALGPVLEQLNQDCLDPLIDRTFNIMARRGLLPEPPEEIQGVPLKVEYISIMAQAQKALGLGALRDFTGYVMELGKATGDPSIWDKVDRDELIDQYGDATGVTPRVIVDDEQVAQVRAARAQAARQQQQLAAAEQAAATAQTLSQTDTDRKNALTDLLGPGLAPGVTGGAPTGVAA